jgi:hypothetical protein
VSADVLLVAPPLQPAESLHAEQKPESLKTGPHHALATQHDLQQVSKRTQCSQRMSAGC